MNKKVLIVFAILFLLGDCFYSFLQHFHMPLDGDIAETVVPVKWIWKLFHDPFGFNVIFNGESYPNPNRFFAHFSMFVYLRKIPLLLQNFVSPVTSVYLSCALFKTTVQILFIGIISYISCISLKRINFINFLLAALFITPLFQTEGYNRFMGVIDQSVTYTFFYAFPVLLIVIFYSVIYNAEQKQRNFFIVEKIILIILVIILPFSGPLIPGVFLISGILIILKNILFFYRRLNEGSFFQKIISSFKKLPEFLIFILVSSVVLSIYSLYLGTFNESNNLNILSLQERYLRLPSGIFYLLTQKIGWSLFLFMLLLNYYLIYKIAEDERKQKIMILIKWIGFFSLIYILVLPLGGYRNYRFNIIRYDTILPVTISLFFIYSVTTLFILQHFSGKAKQFYIVVLVLISVIFTVADVHKLNMNEDEKAALQQIINSNEKITLIKSDCTIISWEKINSWQQSEMNAQLLLRWNITNGKKYYYQK